MEKFKYLKKEEANRLPKTPGVYAFKKGTEFLYIGKAANIRERVKNHFQQPVHRNHLFLDQVKKIGFIKTDSEIEALILEANLIKKFQPKYNVIWRDDKNYFFVGVTKEEFPRVFWTHQTKVKSQKSLVKSQFIGPFVDGKALKETLKTLRKVFPYRSCYKISNRPCLWYHLERCPAPCLLKTKFIKEIGAREAGGWRVGWSPPDSLRLKKICQRNAKNLMRILKEGKNPVLKELKKEMKKASTFQDFEEAAKIRDQIEALEKVLAHSRVFEEPTVPQTSLWYYREIEEGLRNLLK